LRFNVHCNMSLAMAGLQPDWALRNISSSY